MSALTRMTFGDLDLAVIDPHARDTDYIYDEIFARRIYDHPKLRVPAVNASHPGSGLPLASVAV